MMRRTIRRPSPAMVVALLALAVALSGTGYAAVSLPANSVGTDQLRNRAVTETKVKLHTLRARDFAQGQIPSGPRGPQGQPGQRGPTGAVGPTGPSAAPGGTSSALWASVSANGTLGPNQGVASVTRATTGDYDVKLNRDISTCAVTATTNTFSALPATATATSVDAKTVEVQTFDQAGTHADEDFSLAIFC